MAQQIPISAEARADDNKRDAERDDGTHEIAPDLAYRRLGIVNVVFFGLPDAPDRGWVLIDAGLPGTRRLIESAAKARFGENSRPAAIVMTHGHFDHVGSLEALAEAWEAPVLAHRLERPYLDGSTSYPPPDPTVGGGLMATLSPLFPTKPVDISSRLQELPADGTVPFMPGWRWIQTPGHAPGHISLWRESDRAMIVGDAFVTTAQESVYAAATQEPELHGPPKYFTPDWESSRESVRKLAALEPELVVTGHGRPMRGQAMRTALHELADRFDEVAVPDHGRYVDQPARAEDGSAYREP